MTAVIEILNSLINYRHDHSAAESQECVLRFIGTSPDIINSIKFSVTNLAERGLRKVYRRFQVAKITVLNLICKKIKVIDEIVKLEANIWAYDLHAPSLATKAGIFTSVGNVEKALEGADCALFLVDHDPFRQISGEMIRALMASPVIIDGKNLFCREDRIVYLAIGKG